MNDFTLWFSTGFYHIANWQAYDHIAFVTLLVFTFDFSAWKKLLVLVTAFTLGHSLSLALSATGIINAPRLLTELLIALSILLTSIYQLYNSRKDNPGKQALIYPVVAFFGLVHGMGFSFILTSMLGHESNISMPLLWFNLGLEAGQLLIISLVILFSLLLTAVLKLPFKPYKQTVICIIALTALKLCVERSLEFFPS